MIVVVQCAATKRNDAGCLIAANGNRVVFVANPLTAPADSRQVYARPDDLSDHGMSWRDVLLGYNKEPGNNPLGLYQAYRLYENPVYDRLMRTFGTANLYILSAGWGLINSAFLTPYYDITFTPSAENHKRRRKSDSYHDFCMLPHDVNEEIVFLGGKDYLPLFCSITSAVQARKTVFFNSAHPPDMPGCRPKRFPTFTRTNWHYECANALVDGRIGP